MCMYVCMYLFIKESPMSNVMMTLEVCVLQYSKQEMNMNNQNEN